VVTHTQCQQPAPRDTHTHLYDLAYAMLHLRGVRGGDVVRQGRQAEAVCNDFHAVWSHPRRARPLGKRSSHLGYKLCATLQNSLCSHCRLWARQWALRGSHAIALLPFLFEDSESPCGSPLLGSMAAMVAYMALH
jgi:hypothetical protein